MTDRLARLEKLAALAAGELGDDDRAELERQLAADPTALREQAALADADQVLASARRPELPDGAHDRLMHALGPILDEQLGPVETVQPASRWHRLLQRLPDGPMAPRLAAAAAAVAVIAGAGIGLSQIGGRGNDGFAAVEQNLEGGAAEDGDTTSGGAGPDIAGLAPDEAMRASGGVYDDESARDLLDFYAAKRGHGDTAAAPEAPAAEDDGAPAATLADPAPAEDQAFADIDRCAEKWAEAGEGTQLHGELATWNDEPVVVFVIERPDGELELWILEREDCGILVFETAD